jgi:hypothetical protein
MPAPSLLNATPNEARHDHRCEQFLVPRRAQSRSVLAAVFCAALAHDQWARRRSRKDQVARSRWVGDRSRHSESAATPPVTRRALGADPVTAAFGWSMP